MAKRKRYGSTEAAHRRTAGDALYNFRAASKGIAKHMSKAHPDCSMVLQYFRDAAQEAGRYLAERTGEGASMRVGSGVVKKLNGLEDRVYKRCIVKGGGYGPSGHR